MTVLNKLKERLANHGLNSDELSNLKGGRKRKKGKGDDPYDPPPQGGGAGHPPIGFSSMMSFSIDGGN